ncbi:hypothetical protein [Sphingomicrobium arenosum]|uniref:hypothetical protein n=1 Tax=Sphingomicrobium arenosum TaxID=2233861 RepID=UPI0022405D46|nr:hypothetical protein [Sphingomicrobium arenosum]
MDILTLSLAAALFASMGEAQANPQPQASAQDEQDTVSLRDPESDRVVVVARCRWENAPSGRRVGARKKCMSDSQWAELKSGSATSISRQTWRRALAYEQSKLPR